MHETRTLYVDDLVYIAVDKIRTWTRVIVDDVILGKDGRIQRAIVRLASNVRS